MELAAELGGKKIVASISLMVSAEDITFEYFTMDCYGNKIPVNQNVRLDHTPCNYGGRRAWFSCGCGRKIARLFITPRRIACRHCLNLTYSSQVENYSDRAFRRRDRFLEKLGGELINIDVKPKNMHLRTWERLRAICIRECLSGLGAGLDELWN